MADVEATVPPISRYGFSYSNNSFTVDLPDKDSHHKHTRADINTLSSLLRSETPTSPTQSTPRRFQDNASHWYQAQLLHYGLKFTKDKQIAKRRLLEALNNATLEVPSFVRDLERDLKMEWEEISKERFSRAVEPESLKRRLEELQREGRGKPKRKAAPLRKENVIKRARLSEENPAELAQNSSPAPTTFKKPRKSREPGDAQNAFSDPPKFEEPRKGTNPQGTASHMPR